MTHRYEEWQIKAPDGITIYGVTDYAFEDRPSDKALVLVHGLTGHINEYHMKGAANYFSAHGYDVIRFNLYPGGDGRHLIDTNLQDYASDLNTVLKSKTNTYNKIFIAGHSYGGPTIMIAQPDTATALSLWDPTFDLSTRFAKGRFIFEQQGALNIWKRGVDVVLGDKLINEYRDRYDAEECLALSRNIAHVPIQVIAADEANGSDPQSWHSAGHADNHRHIIQNCDHCFWRGRTFDEVLDLSHQWFERL